MVPFTQGTESALQTLIKQHNTPVRKVGIILLCDGMETEEFSTLSVITLGILSKVPYGWSLSVVLSFS